MPIIDASDYQPHRSLRFGHSNTISSALLRKIEGVSYRRERLLTPDDDFVDIDWSELGSDQLVIICHGLEGNAERPYIKGMVRTVNDQGWDGLAINFRGCSGEDNWQLRSYHMGETNDLHLVIQHAVAQKKYKAIYLCGYSLGGNVVLMYLSRDRNMVPKEVKCGVAFSVPAHIPTANNEISKWHNALYVFRFMRSLKQKLKRKITAFPEAFPHKMPRSRHFLSFDNYYTAPVHGFKDAHHYWRTSSCLDFLPHLGRPALLINAQDDTFLSPQCYPIAEAKRSALLHLAMPKFGGHVGFLDWNRRTLWNEEKAMQFMSKWT